MTQQWTPDTCPASPPCILETDPATGEPIAVVRTCAFHAKRAVTEPELCAEILATNRDKNYGTAAAAEALGIEHHLVPWEIDTAGALKIKLPADRKGDVIRVRAAVEQRIGVGKLTVE